MSRTMTDILIALMLGASTIGAQDTVRASAVEMKSPTVARVVGIIPGAGHIYAGETGRGLLYMGGTLGVLALGAMVLAVECLSDLGVEEDCNSSGADNVVTAAVLAVWGWSIYDAGRAAHRTNARRRLRMSLLVAPARSAAAYTRDGRAVKLGLSLGTR